MTTSLKLAAVVCSIGVGACASAATAQAPGPSNAASRRATMPVEGAIANPDWAQLPNGEVLSNYFPPFARFLELSGLVKMQCDVTTTGALDDCVILEEKPAGLGFGEATLSVAQYFRMKPETLDGVPVAGGKVIIPLKWQRTESIVPSDPNADAPAPSPEALALGRRLVAAMGGAQQAAAFFRATIIARTQSQMGAAAGTPEGQAAVAALDKGVDAEIAGYEETRAVEYAKTFSADELRALATFYESPTGQAWRAHQETTNKANAYAGETTWLQIIADARREICAMTTCLREEPSVAAEADQRAKP